MISDFLQDKLINKLTGYYLLSYGNHNIKLAWFLEKMNNAVVFCLVVLKLIPARRRLI
ncbi:MAG: hypothetical protein ACMUJM_06740 [bacterium]